MTPRTAKLIESAILRHDAAALPALLRGEVHPVPGFGRWLLRAIEVDARHCVEALLATESAASLSMGSPWLFNLMHEVEKAAHRSAAGQLIQQLVSARYPDDVVFSALTRMVKEESGTAGAAGLLLEESYLSHVARFFPQHFGQALDGVSVTTSPERVWALLMHYWRDKTPTTVLDAIEARFPIAPVSFGMFVAPLIAAVNRDLQSLPPWVFGKLSALPDADLGDAFGYLLAAATIEEEVQLLRLADENGLAPRFAAAPALSANVALVSPERTARWEKHFQLPSVEGVPAREFVHAVCAGGLYATQRLLARGADAQEILDLAAPASGVDFMLVVKPKDLQDFALLLHRGGAAIDAAPAGAPSFLERLASALDPVDHADLRALVHVRALGDAVAPAPIQPRVRM